MPKEFKLPSLGEEVDAGDVISVLVSEGDEIQPEQTVIEIETDKATLEVPCDLGGRITKVHVREGDHVKVGDPIVSVSSDGEADGEGSEEEEAQEEKADAEAKKTEKKKDEKKKDAKEGLEEKKEDEKAEGEEEAEEEDEARPKQKKKSKTGKKTKPGKRKAKRDKTEEAEAKDEQAEAKDEPEKQAEEPEEEPGPSERPSGDGGKPVPAGPATRRLARELGVDLREVADAHAEERVTEDHVKAFVRERLEGGGAAAKPGVSIPPLPDFSKWGKIDRIPRSNMARRVAERMSASWAIAPHVTHCDEADVTRLEAMRRRYMARAGEGRPKLTVTALVIKAAVHALRAYPKFNASLDAAADELVIKHYYHIGVAVDTEEGLIVPVVRDCDQKSALVIAAELEGLAERARQRQTKLEELRGGTFTITNVGGIGGTVFSPLVNYPEVAILGVTRARQESVGGGRRALERMVLPLCLSFDHRVINGADAARFARKLVEGLEDPELLLLES